MLHEMSILLSDKNLEGGVSRSKLKCLIDGINASKIEDVHLTGGEPTQSPYLESIVKLLQNKRIYITTNLVNRIEMLEFLLENYNIYSIAVSLDSIRPEVNDRLRGKTNVVLSHIARLAAFIESHKLETKLRMHCVMSKPNLEYIPELLLWAKSMNMDEVSCQPISISPNHRYYSLLHLDCADMETVQKIWQLESKLFCSAYAISHSKLMEYYLRNEDCFISHGRRMCSLFIDANGDIWNCPRKLGKQPDVFAKPKEGTCQIIPQCMTCLKHFVVQE